MVLPVPWRSVASVGLWIGVAAGAGCRGAETVRGGASGDLPEMTVTPTEDFELTGDGSAPAWERAAWVPLHRRAERGLEYRTRVRLLYSATGLYVLMDASDARITATMTEDFLDLWHEDVFEVFLWTDEAYPVYFEYEISPLGRELPILIPNFQGDFLGWRPWHYEGERLTRRATTALGGPRDPVEFPALTDWTMHAAPGIRYYSGPAVYAQIFKSRHPGLQI